jgi:hypothetical protein
MAQRTLILISMGIAWVGYLSISANDLRASDHVNIVLAIDSLNASCNKIVVLYSVKNIGGRSIIFASMKAPGEEYILENGRVLGKSPGSVCVGPVGRDSCEEKVFSEIPRDKKIKPGQSLHSWLQIETPHLLPGKYFLRIRYDSRVVEEPRQIWRGTLNAFWDSIKIEECRVPGR